MVKYAKFVGANTDHLTAQSFVFPRAFSENTKDNLHLAVIISCAGEDVFTKVKQTLQQVEDSFLTEDDSIAAKLKRLMDEIKQNLKGAEFIQVLLVSWKMDVLYILSKGNHQCYLNREDKILELTSLKENEELTSGYIKEGDRILLINSKSLDSLEEQEAKKEDWNEKIIKTLINTKLENLEEEANSLIAAQNIQSTDSKEEEVAEDEYKDLPKPIAVVIL
jgi:hypothetical protein